MEPLLPDRLKELWRAVDEHQLSVEAFTSEQERLLDDYRRTWADALILEGHPTLRQARVRRDPGRYQLDAAPLQRVAPRPAPAAGHLRRPQDGGASCRRVRPGDCHGRLRTLVDPVGRRRRTV